MWESGPDLRNTWALQDLDYVVHSCLYEGVHVVEHRTVNGTKYKLRFKEFMKSSKRTGRLAWYDLLVQNDEELVDGAPLHPNGKQIGLSGAVDGINLDACSAKKDKRMSKICLHQSPFYTLQMR